MRAWWLAAGWMLWAFPCAAQQVSSATLENGMRVVVVENHRAPVVTHMLWFRVGAMDDPPGLSGLAHYHEHMMFQGSGHYGPGEYADTVAKHGGRQNAFTGHDATAYYITIAKEFLPLAMQLEADRLRGLKPTDANAAREREVIIEERRQRIENNPQALFSEQLQAALFLRHPYHTPVIGWKHEMEALTAQDVLALHTHAYNPSNAVLIVSGDMTLDEVKPLAERYYGNIPAGPAFTQVQATEPPQLAERRLSMAHANAEQPWWVRRYIAASINSEDKKDVPALFVLAHVLGGSNSSRLHQALVVKHKLAAAAEADYSGFARGPGMFELSVVPAAGASLSELERITDEVVNDVVEKGISADELARAKTLLKAEIVYEREGTHGIAQILGWLLMVGTDEDYYRTWPERVEAVTADDVHKAATRALVRAHSVTGILTPEKKP